MRRVLRVGGHAVWRSAAKYPWYRQRFELAGFKVEPIDIREDGLAIDRVNMYASCKSPPYLREFWLTNSLARREGLDISRRELGLGLGRTAHTRDDTLKIPHTVDPEVGRDNRKYAADYSTYDRRRGSHVH